MENKFIPQQLPSLPYAFDALEPVISKEIMELHYGKHHATYVNKLNEAQSEYLKAEAAGDISKMIALQSAIKFNGGGHINHSIFWTNLSPQNEEGGKEPKGSLKAAIETKFQSLQKFIEYFSAQAIAIQGSGWAWLGYCPKGKCLAVTTCKDQDPVIMQGLIPLLGIDVWEHAYYLQYKNVRADYVKEIWKIINWKNVQERFEEAQK